MVGTCRRGAWPARTGRNRAFRCSPGRDPHTGERLISAQESAGRRDKLGSGNPIRFMHDGEPLFGEADAAAVLGVTKAEVSRMLDAGASMNPVTDGDTRRRVLGRVLGRVSTSAQFRGAYLTPITDSGGSRWVTETERRSWLLDGLVALNGTT